MVDRNMIILIIICICKALKNKDKTIKLNIVLLWSEGGLLSM